MALKSPISPKPSKSKYQSLGYMFGSPRVDLDPNILPTKLDVIKFWMNLVATAKMHPHAPICTHMHPMHPQYAPSAPTCTHR